MRHKLLRLMLASAAVLAVGAVARADAGKAAEPAAACPTVAPTVLRLPRLRQAIEAGKPVVIAAIGSSSTYGAMAHDIGDSYPAELQDLLTAALPDAEISVINRGINGEDAGEEDARMRRDAVALGPQLVIWQVGANSAIRHESVTRFAHLVRRGVDALTHAGVDLILMDNQRSRMVVAAPTDARINTTLARIARESGVNLFSRDRLMRSWAGGQATPPSGFLASDGLHLNDLGYRCLARALAGSILRAASLSVSGGGTQAGR